MMKPLTGYKRLWTQCWEGTEYLDLFSVIFHYSEKINKTLTGYWRLSVAQVVERYKIIRFFSQIYFTTVKNKLDETIDRLLEAKCDPRAGKVHNNLKRSIIFHFSEK